MGTTGAWALGFFVVLSGKGVGSNSHYNLVNIVNEVCLSGSASAKSCSELNKAIKEDGWIAYGRTSLRASLEADKKVQAAKTQEILRRINLR